MSSLLETSATQYVGMAVLARNVSINLATTAAVALCTASRSVVPMYVVIRAGATAWSTTGSFAVGITAALSSIVSTKVATSMLTTAPYLLATFSSGSTAANGLTVVAAGSTIYFNMVQVEPTATASTVDLLGYIF